MEGQNSKNNNIKGSGSPQGIKLNFNHFHR